MAVLLALTLALAGCGPRPVGDFGRAAPSHVHDFMAPAAARVVNPGADLNLTGEEKGMHDRVWRFLVAAHAGDWFHDFAVELRRTGLAGGPAPRFAPARYYDWLRREPYRAAETRYATLGRHALADLDTLPATFTAICAVIEIDRRRATALAALPRLDADMAGKVAARKAENEGHIAWFAAALAARHAAYEHALDHLLVETPHPASVAADQALSRLAPWVARAEAHDFCGRGPVHAGWSGTVLPSRYATQRWDGEVVAIK